MAHQSRSRPKSGILSSTDACTNLEVNLSDEHSDQKKDNQRDNLGEGHAWISSEQKKSVQWFSFHSIFVLNSESQTYLQSNGWIKL